MTSAAIRILIVDDHRLFRMGLCALLKDVPGIQVAAQAATQEEALKAVQDEPDVILLDLDLGESNALDFIPQLLEASPNSRVLVVTALPDPEAHLRAVQIGAMGVLLKLESAELLVKAIRKVHSGEVWLNRGMMSNVLTHMRRGAGRKRTRDEEKIASLTARELEVIAMVSEGLRNKQIGERLFIAEKTVRHYLTAVYSKLEVSDRLELLIYAYSHGLVRQAQPRQSLSLVRKRATDTGES